MQIFIRIFLLISLFIAIPLHAEEKKQHFIGFLEELPDHEVTIDGKTQKIYPRQIRIMFYKEGQEWKTIPKDFENFPAETIWTIAFDGKNLGQVTGQKKTEAEEKNEGGYINFSYFNHGAGQKIVSQSTIPTIGKRTWVMWNGVAVHRPLVANSEPYYKDPDGWKPSTLSDDVVKKLRQSFREHYPHVTNYIKTGSDVRKPWLYKDIDIKISKSYSAKTGWSIAGLYLANWHGDGPTFDEADAPFFDQWFAIPPTHEVTFLRKGMTPLDAGDYDNSGKSAWIFSLNDDNRYGYAIFYDDFKKQAVFEDSFH